MKSHLFNGRNFSTERSHLPRAFSSSIGFLADRAPPLRTTQTPLNPRRRQEGCFFSRELTVEGKRQREEERDSCPCFLIILKRSLERVASYVWIEEIDGRGWARTCSRLFVAGVSRAIRWTVSCLLDIPWCVLWFLFSFGSGREMRWENRDRERGGKG